MDSEIFGKILYDFYNACLWLSNDFLKILYFKICPLAICCLPLLQQAKRHICAIETMLDGHLLDQWILAGNHPNTSCYMEKSSPGDSK